MKKRIVSVCMGMLLLTTVLGCGGKSSVLEGEQGTGTDTVNGSSKTESSTEQQMQVVDNYGRRTLCVGAAGDRTGGTGSDC